MRELNEQDFAPGLEPRVSFPLRAQGDLERGLGHPHSLGGRSARLPLDG